MTRAARLVAHWVRIRPTPPAPACTSTVSPCCTGNADLISRCAVMPFSMAAAATSGADSVWHEATNGWGNAVFGVCADRVGGHNAVAHGKRRDAVADCLDRAAYLGADHKRKFARVRTRPEVGVDEIHADRFGFDQHLARPG